MAWLLDTNAWIDYMRNPASAIRGQLAEGQPEEILTCAVVRAELLHGAMNYGVPERRLAMIRETPGPYRSLPFDDAAAEHYAAIRHELEQQGERIGPHDLLIAAICRAHGCALVTANVAEFRRVAGLKLENWQAASRAVD